MSTLLTTEFIFPAAAIISRGYRGAFDHQIHPLTHASVPEASRSAIGITPELVRIAVGLEDVDD
ncbi:MAG: PLP-dependent transferase [Bryobacteraceae bacterium]